MSTQPDTPKDQSFSDKLLKSSGIVGFMTMLSRVLGLVRDVVFANFFGASAAADAFFVAFKIPNFFRRLFAEGAFSQAFVPVLSEYRLEKSHAEVKTLVDAVAGMLGAILALVTLVAMACAPWLTAVFAPGFIDDEAKYQLASEMLTITFPYLFLISLTAFAGSVLNSYGNFAIPAFTPVMLNLVLIAATVWLTPLFAQSIVGLAWGVLLAGMVQLFLQLPFLLKLGLLPRPRVDYHHEGVRRIGTLMLPALFGVSVSQINLLLDTVLASFLETGSVSWLYYSDRLAELPLGIFGIAIATVILPSLSSQHTSDDPKQFSATLNWAVGIVLTMGVPAAAALILLAEPLIATLFFYGATTERDVVQSALSLQAYASGLLAFMLIKVLATGFFSRQDTKTPVRIGIIAMVANMVFNLILIWPLAHTGLALATSLSSWLNAILLWRVLSKEGVFTVQNDFLAQLLRIGFASVLMCLAVRWINPAFAEWVAWGAFDRILWVALLVSVGVLVYFAVLKLCGMNFRSVFAPPSKV